MHRPVARQAIRRIALAIPFSFIAVGLPAAEAAAQEDDPARRLSPVGIARTHIDDGYVKVVYGRPYIRDRVIFGAPTEGDDGPLVPYGRLWRTGANEATEITLTEPLMVAGQRLDAGTYAIFTVPGPDRWTVRFSPQLGMDGTGSFDPATQTFTPIYDEAMDALAVEVEARTLAQDADPMTFTFEPTATGADLLLRWARTEVRIPMAAAR